MNTKSTLILLTMAILISVWYLVFETDMFGRRTTTTRQREAADEGPKTGEPLFAKDALNADKITTIRIETPGEPAAVIERVDGKWKQTQPVTFAMQDYSVRDVIDYASGLRRYRTITPNEKLTLEAMGLDKPAAVVTFEGEGVEKQVVRLGHKVAGGRAYLMLGEAAGGTAYIADDALHARVIDSTVREMRNSSLAAGLTVGNARKITLTRDGKTIELTKRDGKWALTAPTVGRADKAAADSLVTTLSSAWVGKFIKDNPDKLATYGLDHPQVKLVIETAEPVAIPPAADSETDKKPDAESAKDEQPKETVTTHTLLIGGATDLNRENFFAMYNDAPVVFTLSKSSVDRLNKSVDDLRDPRLTPVAKADLKEVTLTRPASGNAAEAVNLHLIQDQGTWAFGDPKPPFRLEPSVGDKLLTSFLETKAVQYVDLADQQPGETKATVELAVVAQPQAERLSFFDHDADHLMVVREGESVGYVVKRGDVETVLADPAAYRNLNVLDIGPNDVMELKLTRTGQYPASFRFGRNLTVKVPTHIAEPMELGDWRYGEYDRQAVQAVLNAVAPLRAVKWLTRQPSGLEGKDTAVVELTTTDGQRHTFTLYTDALVGAVSGVEAAFTVEESLRAALQAELRNRLVLDLDADEMDTVKVGELTIKRTTDGAYVAVGGAEINEQTVGALFDTLAGLQAERLVDASWAAGDPVATITVTTRNDAAHTLKVHQTPGGLYVGQLGDKTFVLPKTTAEKLTANLTGKAPAAE